MYVLGEVKEESDEDLLKKDFEDEVDEEFKNYKYRLMFRNKYALPPLDPRYLEMTDEDIVKDLLLMHRLTNPDEEDSVEKSEKNGEKMESYKTSKKNWEEIVKQLDDGVDVFSQLSETLKTNIDEWEEVK